MRDPDPRCSRFVRLDDPRSAHFVYPLPAAWWSRPYEYAWAARFATPKAAVLDAGAGIPHPFKFWLAAFCHRAAALDLDPRLADPAAIRAAVVAEAGAAALRRLPPSWPERLERQVGNLTALPWPDASFDRVFCLSTLEHLPEADQLPALRELARVLRPQGLLVLTVDVPPLTTGDLHFLVAEAGLEFAGPVDFLRPPEAVFASPWGRLSCFRALLQRTEAGP
ncbi:Methyltransf_11 domain-containing protein [Candidatus Hydrogenisulfobacillus filiaventi]|uniref:Methyltransf_11 domain-containing protein n=1 Tax=Candidatus Hydrogenisulfobacillus filiaventi TaxID=2707344 RepID=A0A6F8ZDJ1_9FIRM|nr:class I SAM-dependent methyltransferase [Bacillota bacterium]CAB1127827.1 Methyltransf_11 domain-containing protein [Candidatus Hydrogenisulfobacillus filiaventi]